MHTEIGYCKLVRTTGDTNIKSVSSKLSFHITEHLFKTWISQTYKALVTKEATKKKGTKPRTWGIQRSLLVQVRSCLKLHTQHFVCLSNDYGQMSDRPLLNLLSQYLNVNLLQLNITIVFMKIASRAYSPESWIMICPFLYRILLLTSNILFRENINSKILVKNNNLTIFNLLKLFQ